MQLTDIRIREASGEGKLRAYVTITFDDCFVVHNVKIIEGKEGLFIAMPSRKNKVGEYKDVAHPIKVEFRTELQDQILEKYRSGDFESGSDYSAATDYSGETDTAADYSGATD
jgi:stage V sporulation protein G